MKFLVKLSLLLVLLLLAGGVTVVALLLEDEPLVPGVSLVAADLRDARVFLENSDPRRLQSGELEDFTINERDLELLLNYMLDNLRGGRSQVALSTGNAELRLSARQPFNPLGEYLNLRMVFTQQSGALALDSLQAGRIVVPGWIADPLMQRAHTELRERVPEYRDALAAIDSFAIDEGRLNIVYEWQPELLEQLSTRGSGLLLGEVERERLLAHSRKLAELMADPALGARMPLVDVLAPMFAFARGRQGDPVEENRAALQALSLYASRTSVPQLLGEAGAATPQQRDLILAGREDRARHFLISAGLAVSTDSGIAQSLGLLKEVDDSQGGSGFSFVDIGADRTGIRFAQLAVLGPAEARRIQDQMAAATDETLFMADFRDLPELLSEEAFQAAYGGVGEPAYNAVMQDIEARIGQTPLFLP